MCRRNFWMCEFSQRSCFCRISGYSRNFQNSCFFEYHDDFFKCLVFPNFKFFWNCLVPILSYDFHTFSYDFHAFSCNFHMCLEIFILFLIIFILFLMVLTFSHDFHTFSCDFHTFSYGFNIFLLTLQ